MIVLFQSTFDNQDWWREELGRRAPALDVRYGIAAVEDRTAVEYAIVWGPPPGVLASLPRLKAIFSIGAGIDHLNSDPLFPRHLPLTRVVDDNMTRRMTEWVVHHVLRHHLQQPAYDAQQRARVWRRRPQLLAAERRVGLLGLGVLGRAAGEALVRLGFPVAGLTRTPHAVPGIAIHSGPDALPGFLAASDILVVLAPLTAATDGLLDRTNLGRLPPGAAVINAARGRIIVEADLLALLDADHLSGASLDVFVDEPLPPNHRFWTHPKVTVIPHAAATTDPRSVISQFLAAIEAVEAGREPANLVDWTKGY